MVDQTDSPTIIRGGVAVDDRGALTFINDLDLSGYKRFYTVQNHAVGLVRAWHAHKVEAKTAIVMTGSALVCAVKIDDWDSPSPGLEVKRFVLSAKIPSALQIPAGYANGFMNLTRDTQIMFLSTSTIDQSLGDDFRFSARLWDPWSVEER